ncbi:MAG: ribonuclease III [Pelagibacteraceae bacterium]
MTNNKIENLQKIIKIKFNNIDLLKQSLIHKSYDNNFNNEKLEFLGDRVLGLVLSKTLIKNYPDEKEGIIDKKFANLVNKKTCTKISNTLDIKKYMVIGDSHKNLKKADEKIMSDCLEALIGAIFLDKGIDVSEKFILEFWSEYLINSNYTLIDSKTKLQEYSLKKFKLLPKYKVFKQSGPQHNPIFKVEVQITNSKKFQASGSSKKDAEQNAAKKLIKNLKI